MPELYAIEMWAHIFLGGLNSEAIIEAICTNEDIVKDFGDLRPELKKFKEWVKEVGIAEAREEYNKNREAGNIKPKNNSDSGSSNSDNTFCPECGNNVMPKAKFCTNCGK